MRLSQQQARAAYWLLTCAIALFMAKSAYAYLTDPLVRDACRHLGFPDYFRVELAVAKLLSVLALLAPVGPRPKEWAYAGFSILLVSAVVAHAASGEPARASAGALALLGLLAASYGLWRRRLPRPDVI